MPIYAEYTLLEWETPARPCKGSCGAVARDRTMEDPTGLHRGQNHSASTPKTPRNLSPHGWVTAVFRIKDNCRKIEGAFIYRKRPRFLLMSTPNCAGARTYQGAYLSVRRSRSCRPLHDFLV